MAAPSTPFSSSMSFTSETKRSTDEIQVVVELPVQPASQEGGSIGHEETIVHYRSYWRRFVGLICLVRRLGGSFMLFPTGNTDDF